MSSSGQTNPCVRPPPSKKKKNKKMKKKRIIQRWLEVTSYFRFIESCAPQPTLGGNFSGPGQADPIFSFYLLGEIPNHWLQFTPFYAWFSLSTTQSSCPKVEGIFKRPSVLGQRGHRYPPKHLKVRYDRFGRQLETSNHPPPLPAATEEICHTRKDPRCKLCSYWSKKSTFHSNGVNIFQSGND